MTLRHLLADDDLTAVGQRAVLDRALALKAAPFADRCLEGPRTVSILFDKPTLRTQASFTAGVAELGGYPMLVDGNLARIGARESVADTARVLGRMVSAVVWVAPDTIPSTIPRATIETAIVSSPSLTPPSRRRVAIFTT